MEIEKIVNEEKVDISKYKVIVFPASRKLTGKESWEISAQLYEFLSNWEAHGKSLTASFKIDYDQFLVVVVDLEKEIASGCSIDVLNDFMRQIDTVYQLGLFDRMKASYLENDEVKTLKLSDFKRDLKSGAISQDIKVFDFSKDNFAEFQKGFLLPLEESWAASATR